MEDIWLPGTSLFSSTGNSCAGVEGETIEVVKRHGNMEMLKSHTFNSHILRVQVEHQTFGTFGVFRNQDFWIGN